MLLTIARLLLLLFRQLLPPRSKRLTEALFDLAGTTTARNAELDSTSDLSLSSSGTVLVRRNSPTVFSALMQMEAQLGLSWFSMISRLPASCGPPLLGWLPGLVLGYSQAERKKNERCSSGGRLTTCSMRADDYLLLLHNGVT